jgi:hypothetical protein
MQELKRFDFTPILGWSVSRYDLFLTCKRKYYYNYYAKHDSSIPRQKIDQLKSMTSIPLEVGNVVHDVNKVLLERLKKTEKEIDQPRFFDYAKRKTEEYCNSKQFSEAYYGEISGINLSDIIDKVQACLGNFLNSDRFDWLFKVALKTKGTWIIEPPGFGETRIDGMKAYCKVDFLFPVEDALYIIDWKTGKADSKKHRKQLIGYSTWTAFQFAKNPEKIVPIVAYLFPDYNELQVDVNEFDIQEFSDRVRTETDEMYKFCSVVEENIPVDKEKFAKTPNTKLCNWCNFRELCFN